VERRTCAWLGGEEVFRAQAAVLPENELVQYTWDSFLQQLELARDSRHSLKHCTSSHNIHSRDLPKQPTNRTNFHSFNFSCHAGLQRFSLRCLLKFMQTGWDDVLSMGG
jgi:hypothetical protein